MLGGTPHKPPPAVRCPLQHARGAVQGTPRLLTCSPLSPRRHPCTVPLMLGPGVCTRSFLEHDPLPKEGEQAGCVLLVFLIQQGHCASGCRDRWEAARPTLKPSSQSFCQPGAGPQQPRAQPAGRQPLGSCCPSCPGVLAAQRDHIRKDKSCNASVMPPTKSVKASFSPGLFTKSFHIQ